MAKHSLLNICWILPLIFYYHNHLFSKHFKNVHCLDGCVCACILITAELCPRATNRSQWTSGCGILETVSPLERWWCVAEDGPCMTQCASPAKTSGASVENERARRRQGARNWGQITGWINSTKVQIQSQHKEKTEHRGRMKAHKKTNGICSKIQ